MTTMIRCSRIRTTTASSSSFTSRPYNFHVGATLFVPQLCARSGASTQRPRLSRAKRELSGRGLFAEQGAPSLLHSDVTAAAGSSDCRSNTTSKSPGRHRESTRFSARHSECNLDPSIHPQVHDNGTLSRATSCVASPPRRCSRRKPSSGILGTSEQSPRFCSNREDPTPLVGERWSFRHRHGNGQTVGMSRTT